MDLLDGPDHFTNWQRAHHNGAAPAGLQAQRLSAGPGLASTATWVPYPLFGLFIEAWVDRVNRKGLMIGLDISHAVVLALLPGLSLFGHLPIWWIYLAP